ncbi:MAG: helix-turn-helix transcriptional regulator [Planctomycetota bacterium]
MSLGRRICEIRQAKSISQAAVARRAGLAAAYLSRIENDHIEPSFKTLHRIAAALRVSLTDLFGYDQQKKFKEHCPVSLSGNCVGQRIYQPHADRTTTHPESYTPRQIQLLQFANYLVLFGNKRVLDTLETTFLAFLRAPSLKKNRAWLQKLREPDQP